MRIISTITAGLAVATIGASMLVGAATPAHAAGCIYKAVQHDGRVLSLGAHGYAAKQKKACKRARKKCDRRLERAYRQGKMPRGVTCKRVASQ